MWKLLIDKEMSKGDLYKASGLFLSMMANPKERRGHFNGGLSKICVCLGCNIGNIVEFVSDNVEA